MLGVQQLIPIAQDGLAQRGLDQGLEPGAGGDVAAVLAGEVITVAGEFIDFRGGGHLAVVVQPRTPGKLDGLAGRDDHRDVELLPGAVHAAFDRLIHLQLVASVAREGAMVRVGGIGPCHVPHNEKL